MTENFKNASIVARQTGLAEEPIDDELLLMSLENNKFYGLDAVSRRIWELVEEPASFDSICEKLIVEFDVDIETCRAEVRSFVQKLLDANLVQITSA